MGVLLVLAALVLCLVLLNHEHQVVAMPLGAIINSNSSDVLSDASMAQLLKGKPVKIYIYDLPAKYNKDLLGQPHTNAEMAEFEVELESLIRNSKFYTKSKYEATHFYIPVYGVTYCAVQKAREHSEGCKRARQFVVEAVSYVKANHGETWNKWKGADHLIASGYDHGLCYATFARDADAWRRPPELENIRGIGFLGVPDTPVANPGRCFGERDIVLPPYVTKAMRANLMRSDSTTRSNSVFLRTGAVERDPVRGQLLRSFEQYPHSLVSSKTVTPEQFATEMRSSKFCLAPSGFAPWSFRLSEAVLAECIPVVPKANALVFPCPKHIDYASFAVLGATTDGDKVKAMVQSVESDAQFIARAQMNMRTARKYFEYGDATLDCLVDEL